MMMKRFLRSLFIWAIALAGLALAAEPVFKPITEVEERFVPAGTTCSVTITVPDFASLPEPAKSNLAGAVTISFPGLQAQEGVKMVGAGKLQLQGKLPKPGVFAFEATLRAGSKTYTTRDFVVSVGKKTDAAVPGSGYYVFLAQGDYSKPTHKNAMMPLADWLKVIDWMAERKIDSLWALVNGYTLGYPSEKYPELRDNFAQNAKYNFLGELIRYAHSKGVRVYLTVTTDDHAEQFGKRFPETVRIDKYGHPRSSRALVLENPKVRKYILETLTEVLDLYPEADGIVIHPTETPPDRFNAVTVEKYRRETNKDFYEASEEERFRWYNEQYADFATEMYRLAAAKKANIDFIMFNCWWQDKYIDVYQKRLPKQMKICVWHYGWDDKEAWKWPIQSWVTAMGPERIVYMPTGDSFLFPRAKGEQVERHIGTDRLISSARAMGVANCVWFAGWDMGTEEGRTRDLMLARYPSGAAAGRPDKKTIERLYTDYFGARQELLKSKGN